MVGIICPSEFEYKVLRHDHLSKRKVALIKSGMGKLKSLYGCHKLASEHKLRHILLVGFAGALTSSLKVGDIIEPDVFIEQDFNAEPLEKFPHLLLKKPNKKILPESLTALMLTQDRFLTENPYKKSAYAKKYKRIACDMESYAVAYFCKEARIKFSVIKLISDCADESADHDFLNNCIKLSPKLNSAILKALDGINGNTA